MRPPPPALLRFLAPYGAAITEVFLATRAAVLAAAPEATELIYDAYNTVSIAYTYSDRLKQAFCHVAAYADHVNLGFNHGATLPDPDELLLGSGASIRHIRIDEPKDVKRTAVRSLLRAAVAQGRALGPTPPRPARSIVQSVSPKKRRPV